MTCHYAATADATAPAQVQYIKGPQMDWAINEWTLQPVQDMEDPIVISYLELQLEALSEACKSKTLLCIGLETRGWNYTSLGGLIMMTSPCKQSGTNLRNIVSPKLMSFMCMIWPVKAAQTRLQKLWWILCTSPEPAGTLSISARNPQYFGKRCLSFLHNGSVIHVKVHYRGNQPHHSWHPPMVQKTWVKQGNCKTHH